VRSGGPCSGSAGCSGSTPSSSISPRPQARQIPKSGWGTIPVTRGRYVASVDDARN
jgi:hypothetical protein